MKITKISINILVAVALFGTLFVVAVPSPVQALTKAEQQACKNKWAGSYLASSQKVKNYRDSGCDTSKGGNCTAKNARIPDDSGREEIRTSIACPVSSDKGAVDGCADLETSIIKCDDSIGNPIISLLLQVINFLAVGVGLAVVGGIIWGGMIYASSNGDANKVQQAKTIIVNAVIGLLLFIFLYAIVNFLVPGGLFT